MVTALTNFSSFDKYIQYVKTIPFLSEQEEINLFSKYKTEGCIESVHKIVTSHLYYVVSIAYKYNKFGFAIQDLVQEGNIGLMLAAKKFDTSFNIRFSQYAKFWIKSQIQQYILDHWNIVKIGTTEVKKKLFYSLSKIKEKMLALSGEIDYKQIAKETNIPLQTVIDVDHQLQSNVYDYTKEDSSESFISLLPSEIPHPEQVLIAKQEYQIRSQKLKNVIDSFNERDQYIVYNRMITDEPKTMQQLSEELGISKERVRQLEEKIFRNIKRGMSV